MCGELWGLRIGPGPYQRRSGAGTGIGKGANRFMGFCGLEPLSALHNPKPHDFITRIFGRGVPTLMRTLVYLRRLK